MPYANNKGTDQGSLISTFVDRCLESIISLVYISEISSLLASFCGCAGRFVSYLVANPEDKFSHDEAHIVTTARFGWSLQFADI